MRKTIQQANERVGSIEAAYNGPIIASQAITGEYLIGVMTKKIFCPKKSEVKTGLFFDNSIPKIRIWGGFNKDNLPHKTWLTNFLFTFAPSIAFQTPNPVFEFAPLSEEDLLDHFYIQNRKISKFDFSMVAKGGEFSKEQKLREKNMLRINTKSNKSRSQQRSKRKRRNFKKSNDRSKNQKECLTISGVRFPSFNLGESLINAYQCKVPPNQTDTYNDLYYNNLQPTKIEPIVTWNTIQNKMTTKTIPYIDISFPFYTIISLSFIHFFQD